METWKEYYNADVRRYSKSGVPVLKFQKYLRKAHFCKNRILWMYYKWRIKQYRMKYGLEIKPEGDIGRGLYIGHAFNINIHPKAVIGENFSIHKGAVIGQQNRGKRKGAPKIGNRVWVGINAVVVGNITIGDDVLIAPLTHVNCDVPSHSVVYGNPCIIKHRDNATEGYITNPV